MTTRANKLREMNFRDYDEYLASPHWRATRQRFSDMHQDRRCFACGRRDGQLDLSHRSYDRLGHEDLTDLVWLCPDDHRAVHEVDNWANDLGLATDYVRLRHLDPQWQALKPAADLLFAPQRTNQPSTTPPLAASIPGQVPAPPPEQLPAPLQRMDRPPTSPPLAAPLPVRLPAPPPRPPTIVATSDQSYLGWATLGVLLIIGAGWFATKLISAIALGSSLDFLLPWPTH